MSADSSDSGHMQMDGKYRNAPAPCQLFPAGVVDRLLALLFPWRCVLCRGRATGFDLCVTCLDTLPWLPCSDSRFEVPGAPGIAGVAALAYTGDAADMVTALKFRGDRSCGRVLGELLVIRLLERCRERMHGPQHGRPVAAVPDIIVPVPLHPARLRQRGYNQADLIARAVARDLAIPVAARGLSRRRRTRAQMRLGRRARLRNLSGAFVAREEFKGRRVALVDDVVTTGATLSGCVHALLERGAVSVECWVVARTLLRQAGDRA